MFSCRSMCFHFPATAKCTELMKLSIKIFLLGFLYNYMFRRDLRQINKIMNNLLAFYLKCLLVDPNLGITSVQRSCAGAVFNTRQHHRPSGVLLSS